MDSRKGKGYNRKIKVRKMIKKINTKVKNIFLRLFFPEILNEMTGLQRMKYVKRGKDCRLISCTVSSEPYLVSIGDHVSATRCHFETHDGGGGFLETKILKLIS